MQGLENGAVPVSAEVEPHDLQPLVLLLSPFTTGMTSSQGPQPSVCTKIRVGVPTLTVVTFSSSLIGAECALAQEASSASPTARSSAGRI